MGYLGVKTLVAHIKGEQVEKRIDTGVQRRHAREHGPAGDEGAAAAGSLEMAEVSQRRSRRASRCAASARRSARRWRSTASTSRVAPGEVVRARRPERRRQEHADEHPVGRARSPTRATMTLDGAPYAPREPARRAPRRRRDDLPGAVARAAPVGDGEHRARHGAGALRRACDWRARARAAPRRARRSSGTRDIAPDAIVGRAVGRRRSSSSRSRAPSRAAAACSCSTSRRAASAAQDVRAAVRRSSARLRAQGLAIVYISHFLEEVKQVADRFVVLRDGRNAGGGPTARRRRDRDRRADGRPRASTTCIRARRAQPRRSVLEVDGPAAGRRQLHAAPRRGARHRGPLGAGRTRLLRAIFGLEPVRSGPRPRRRVRRARRARAALGAGRRHAQRGPQGRGAGARPERRRQPHALAPRRPRARPARAARRARTRGRGAGSSGSAIRCAGPRQPVARAVGRQPAEGRARAPAPPRRRRAAARRADARHRRRRARRRSTR